MDHNLCACVLKIAANLDVTQCLNLCLLSALLLGILYLFFGAFPLVFGNNHGFTLSQVGLTFLGLFVGMMLGISCDPLWRRYYNRLVVRNQGRSEPEFRLLSTVAGALIVPVGLFGGCILILAILKIIGEIVVGDELLTLESTYRIRMDFVQKCKSI